MKRVPLKRSKGIRRSSPARTAEDEVYKDVRMAVLQRDGNRCQLEGRSVVQGVVLACAGPLHVHHIDGRSSRTRRLDPEGLLTLCRAHHAQVHSHPREARELRYLR